MLPVFSGVWVARLLLLRCMYYFSYFMFFVVYVWLLSLDCIRLITAITLVPLVTLVYMFFSCNMLCYFTSLSTLCLWVVSVSLFEIWTCLWTFVSSCYVLAWFLHIFISIIFYFAQANSLCPLHFAAKLDSVECLMVLIEHKAKIEKKEKRRVILH